MGTIESGADSYETPQLRAYGTIEEWTHGAPNQIIISIIIGGEIGL